jgi:hypothetical protein
MILIRTAVLLLATAGAYAQCKTIAPDAQDGPIASPENHTVLYEDADVRVLDVHSQPHTREAWHTHARPAVMYVDSQGAGRYMQPGQPDSKVRPKDDPTFKFRIFATEPEGVHATENTGNVPFHAIRVEFKHPGCSLSPSGPVAKPGPEDALIAAPADHSLLFENDDVRVLDVHTPAHTLEPVHTHPWPGFFYIITPAPLRYFPAGAKAGIDLPSGSAGPKIVPIGAEGPHLVENTGDVAMHFIRFELKHATPK